jgi:hypothetical protein
MYYSYDWTIILLLIGVAICALASARLKRTFATYRNIPSMSGMTGAQAAQRILHMAGVYDVQVVPIQGELTDHYDPRTKKVCLSQPIYNKTSLAAVGVAAHECGHAIQHNTNYAPLSVRSAIVPVANLGSQLSWPLFLIGLIFSVRPLLLIGILLFSAAVLFQLVTLPVEFNASARALKLLEADNILAQQEVPGARKVLFAAALTYVAALASSVLQLLRLVILAGGGRKRD